MAENRRRFTRVPFNVVAKLIVAGAVHSIDAVNDLSVGGCSLTSDLKLPSGTSCDIQISLGDSVPQITIQIGATVVRHHQGQLAVKFLSIDPDGLYHLQRIILYNAEQPDDVEKEIEKHPGLF